MLVRHFHYIVVDILGNKELAILRCLNNTHQCGRLVSSSVAVVASLEARPCFSSTLGKRTIYLKWRYKDIGKNLSETLQSVADSVRVVIKRRGSAMK